VVARSTVSAASTGIVVCNSTRRAEFRTKCLVTCDDVAWHADCSAFVVPLTKEAPMKTISMFLVLALASVGSVGCSAGEGDTEKTATTEQAATVSCSDVGATGHGEEETCGAGTGKSCMFLLEQCNSVGGCFCITGAHGTSCTNYCEPQ
jgi:hypothetical protein